MLLLSLAGASLLLPATLLPPHWAPMSGAPTAPSPRGAPVLASTPSLARRTRTPIAATDFGIEFDFHEDDEVEAMAKAKEDSEDALVAMEAALTERPADNLTVAELKTQLKQAGQRLTGTKAQLVERVQLMQRKRALGLPIHEIAVKRNEDMSWYMLQTANGFERAVEKNLNNMVKAQVRHTPRSPAIPATAA